MVEVEVVVDPGADEAVPDKATAVEVLQAIEVISLRGASAAVPEDATLVVTAHTLRHTRVKIILLFVIL